MAPYKPLPTATSEGSSALQEHLFAASRLLGCSHRLTHLVQLEYLACSSRRYTWCRLPALSLRRFGKVLTYCCCVYVAVRTRGCC